MQLTFQDLADLEQGAAFLGAGGGGNPYCGRLMVEQALKEGGTVDLIDLAEVPDDALVIPTAMMGAPTVLIEKLPHGDEAILSLRRLEKHLGRQAFATLSLEGGGINSTIPLAVGARLDLPVVDADGMGRAFPELHMVTFHVHGVAGTPMAMTNEYGDTVLLTTRDNQMMEWLARGTTIRMGGVAYFAGYAMDGRTAKRAAIPGTLSLGIAIGRTLRLAQEQGHNPFRALVDLLETTPYQFGAIIFEGKVVDVLRQTTDGFARGRAVLESTRDPSEYMDIVFQNEYLNACVNGRSRAIVPDLICLLDSRTARPIITEELSYGQPVKVMAISAPEAMRTPEALVVFGPQAFGLTEAYRPIEIMLEEGTVTSQFMAHL